MPTCSIIIPVYNHVSLTFQCLHAIHDNTSDRVSYEIIVANDASTDLTPQFLANYGDQIRVVTLPRNSGYGAACNAGAAVATGKYLVFLNNDTVPQVNWLEALVDYAETHQQAAILGSKQVFPDDTVQHAGGVFRQDHYPIPLYRGFSKDHPLVNKSRRFQIIAGACLFIRREWFKQVGGFDSAFRNGYEDIDICLRVGKKGGETHYCHQSVILHLELATRGDRTLATDEYRLAEATRNVELYLGRWLACARPDALGYYLEDVQVMLALREVYDLLKGKARPRSRLRLLKARLRSFVYSDKTLPSWLSILRGGMAVMLFFAHMYRERKKVAKN